MDENRMDERESSRSKNWMVGIMAVVILGFCMFGFGSKFIELVYMVLDYDSSASTEGVFAVAPLVELLARQRRFLVHAGLGRFARDVSRYRTPQADHARSTNKHWMRPRATLIIVIPFFNN